MIKPILYLQTDNRWKNIDYSAKGESTTIGKSGCGTTCMAMVIATLKDKTVTPITTAQWSLSHGYKAPNQGTYYTYFVPQGKVYNINVSRINTANIYKSNSSLAIESHDKALQAIKDGNWVVCCMGKGNWTSSGHYILWYGVDGNNALINDPNSTKFLRTCASISLLQSQVKYYWIVEVPTLKTHSDNYHKVQSKYGFDDTTMAYLEVYQYADALFEKMLLSKEQQNYQLNTILYILDYKYGKEIFEKLNK